MPLYIFYLKKNEKSGHLKRETCYKTQKEETRNGIGCVGILGTELDVS